MNERKAVRISLPPLRMLKTIPPGGAEETFDTPEALEINRARMDHLDSMGLPLAGKRVLDVGAGVGHLAQFFISKGCEVICVDGREENIAALSHRYPGLRGIVLNVESDPLAALGRFDIVFCYGLLYHLENPIAAIRNMEAVCDEILLLETVVTDHHLPLLRLDEETYAVSQALRGFGSRPSPSYVVFSLTSAGFAAVYAPLRPPQHPDFEVEWRDDLSFSRDGHLLRSIFIASRREIDNPGLVLLHRSPNSEGI